MREGERKQKFMGFIIMIMITKLVSNMYRKTKNKRKEDERKQIRIDNIKRQKKQKRWKVNQKEKNTIKTFVSMYKQREKRKTKRKPEEAKKNIVLNSDKECRSGVRTNSNEYLNLDYGQTR